MEIANKKTIDVFGAVLNIYDRRFKQKGYLTEADMKLFFKGCSVLCGFPVTGEHLREVMRLLDKKSL